MEWGIVATILIIAACSNAYVYPCLDQCQCDTNDEAIHCHNGRRETLELPTRRLRGFTVIGMTNNAIQRLPSEKELLKKFPDLRAIDVEGNKNFDCESLDQYNLIKIYSECDGNDSLITKGERLPDIEAPNDICNFECQVAKHYKSVHEYVKRLWKILKAKYEEIDKEKLIDEVQEFFSKVVKKINELR